MPLNDKDKEEASMKAFFASPLNRMNIIIFMMMGIGCNFIYYLINFYVKYLPGDMFTNQAVNSISESVSQLFPLFIGKYLSIKNGFAVSFFSAGAGCGIVMFAQMYVNSMAWLVPVAVMLTKGAISCAFCYLYFATISYFESEYLGLAIGFTNVIGRLSNVAAPMVAEQTPPIPMIACIVLSVLSFILCIMLVTPKEAADK